MQQGELQHHYGQRVGRHQPADEPLHLRRPRAGQILDEGRLELGIDQHQQQIGHDQQQKPPVLPEHPQHGTHAGPGRLAGVATCQPEPDDKDDAKQQIAGTEQQEGLLTRAQAIGDAEQRTDGRPQVEQEITQVQRQLTGFGLGQIVGHQCLAR